MCPRLYRRVGELFRRQDVWDGWGLKRRNGGSDSREVFEERRFVVGREVCGRGGGRGWVVLGRGSTSSF